MTHELQYWTPLAIWMKLLLSASTEASSLLRVNLSLEDDHTAMSPFSQYSRTRWDQQYTDTVFLPLCPE